MSVRRVELGSEGDECEAAMAAFAERGHPVVLQPSDARRMFDAITETIAVIDALNLRGVPYRHRQALLSAIGELKAAQAAMRKTAEAGPP